MLQDRHESSDRVRITFGLANLKFGPEVLSESDTFRRESVRSELLHPVRTTLKEPCTMKDVYD